MLTPQLSETFAAFNNLNVLIVGDVMIDSYLWGKVDRISPEAPVPIVSVTHLENRLGGAANVALNVAALGATPLICSVIGNDDKARVFSNLVTDAKMSVEGLVESNDRPTTTKTRIISNEQHLLRVDEEKTDSLSPAEETALIDRFVALCESYRVDVVILQDYNKGVLTAKVIDRIIEHSIEKGIPTAVDPKKENFLAYRKVDLFKPNLKELREGLKIEFNANFEESLRVAVGQLEEKLENKMSLITLSERGVVCSASGEWVRLPAHDRKILDVSGAGDTVISTAALCLALNLEPEILASLSNLAGGIVCEHVGVVPIDKDQLFNEARLLNPVR